MLGKTIYQREQVYKDYGLAKREWTKIKDSVIKNRSTSIQIRAKYKLSSIQIWFLFDKLLQEKYNHLYERELLDNPKVNDYCYCDNDGYRRGTIKTVSGNTMMIKFDSRKLNTLCDVKKMVTIHDEVKRKITKL